MFSAGPVNFCVDCIRRRSCRGLLSIGSGRYPGETKRPGKASEDVDIFCQAGEGVQVRERDDVVSAKVEHHSAVRDCRGVRDDIRSTPPVGQRAGEAQCINAGLEVMDHVGVMTAVEHEGVGARTAKERVIARTAKERVIARTAKPPVIAVAAIDRVIACIANDRVIAIVTNQHLIGGPGNGIQLRSTQGRVCKDELLDIPNRICAVRRNDDIDIPGPGGGECVAGHVEMRLIDATTTVETVVADTAGQKVIAIPGRDPVIASAANDRVIPIAGLDFVIARAGRDPVIASAGKDRVIPIAGKDEVIARTGVDPVVAIPGPDCVIASAPNDRVIPIVADPQLVSGPGNGIQLRSTQGCVSKDELLDIRDCICAVRRNDGIDISGPGDRKIAAGHAETRPIHAAATVETVVADTAEQNVIASAAIDRVIASAGMDFVIAREGRDPVVAGTGPDRVVVIAGKNPVIANVGKYPVIAIAGFDPVIAIAGFERVVVIAGFERDPDTGIQLRSTQGRVRKDELLDIRDRIGALCRNNGIDISRPGDREIAAGHAETRPIHATTTVETVVAGTAGQKVIASTGPERVIASAGMDFVIAKEGRDPVTASAGPERVIASAPFERDSDTGIHLRSTQGRVRKDELLDIRNRICAVRRNNGIDISRPGDREIAAGHAETRLIHAAATVETVVAGTAEQNVIASAAIDRVIASAGMDFVIAKEGRDPVIAGTGPERVIQRGAAQTVITTRTFNPGHFRPPRIWLFPSAIFGKTIETIVWQNGRLVQPLSSDWRMLSILTRRSNRFSLPNRGYRMNDAFGFVPGADPWFSFPKSISGRIHFGEGCFVSIFHLICQRSTPTDEGARGIALKV